MLSSSDNDVDSLDEENLVAAASTSDDYEQFSFTAKKEIKWRKKFFDASQLPTLESRQNANIMFADANPLDYFTKYIKESDYANMTTMTNLYAVQKGNTFKPTNVGEIQTLIGLHIAVGCLKYSQLRMYWNSSIGINLFTDNMSRERFLSLRNSLHLVNILDEPLDCKDKMYKIRPIFEAVRKRCLELDIEQNICVDEQMIPHKGRIPMRQYMRGKPNPWGGGEAFHDMW